jgi:drug/metabolite transporter (DMT)-like permease
MQIDAIKVKHEIYSVFQAGIGLVMVALVVTGIGGTIYKVISPEGWIAQAFGRSASAGAAALGSLMMIAALAWFSRGLSSPRYRNRFSDLIVYGFAAAGFAYLAMYMSKGSF